MTKEVTETKPQTWCACGCGQLTMPGNIFIKYHHVRVNNPMNNPKSVEKLKGENNPSKRPEVRKKISKALTGYKHTKQAKKNMKKAQLQRKNKNQKAWKDMSRKGAINNRKKHPELFEKTLQKYYQENPEKRKENAAFFQKRWKEQQPEQFKRTKRKCVRAMLERRKQMKKENPKKYHMIYSKAAQKRLEKIRKDSPFKWKNVGFLSKMERECAKLLLSSPKEGINCHVKVGRKIIDFFPTDNDLFFQNSFVEFHPWDWEGLTTQQYYENRKKVIDSSSYKGTQLIVIDDLKQLKEMVKNGKTEKECEKN